jgi:hypothetical protein
MVEFDAELSSLFSGAKTRLRASKMDSIIETRDVQIERKIFHVEFRENDRGKFLRITEEAHGRRNTIIIPSTGVNDFTAAISEVVVPSERAQTA